jgi:hypothetical protein
VIVMYSCMKTKFKPAETIPGMGGKVDKRE